MSRVFFSCEVGVHVHLLSFVPKKVCWEVCSFSFGSSFVPPVKDVAHFGQKGIVGDCTSVVPPNPEIYRGQLISSLEFLIPVCQLLAD